MGISYNGYYGSFASFTLGFDSLCLHVTDNTEESDKAYKKRLKDLRIAAGKAVGRGDFDEANRLWNEYNTLENERR